MRICKRVEFGTNLDLICGAKGDVKMWGEIIT